MRKYFLFLITLIPINILKIFLLNLFKGININFKSKIGIGIFFNCNKINIFNSSIGHLNYFVSENIILKNSNIKNMNHFSNLKILKCQEKSIIGSYNLIKSKNEKKKGYLKLNKSQISSNFIIEFYKNLYFGKDVVLGGTNTKIISNNLNKSSTIFLRNIFIGSNVIILDGVRIYKDIIIGANTLVDKNLNKSGKYFSKKLIKI